MSLYYGLWNIILIFPKAVRILMGISVIAAVIYFLWPVEKYIFAMLLQICIWIHLVVMGGARLIVPGLWGAGKYDCDKKIADRGRRGENWLKAKQTKIIADGRKGFFRKKIVWIIFICAYVIAILPVFQLEQYIQGNDIAGLYRVNRFFTDAEAWLTRGIENYSPFWIQETDTMEVLVEEQEMEEELQPVRLELNENTTFANIREEADIHSRSLYAVSGEDEILYQHIYEHDSERFWLKVIISSHDDLEGWISANVIEPEIVDSLDLQQQEK